MKKKHAPRLKSCTKLVQIIGRAFLIMMNNTGVMTLNCFRCRRLPYPADYEQITEISSACGQF